MSALQQQRRMDGCPIWWRVSGAVRRTKALHAGTRGLYSPSYGVFWIGASGCRALAATIVSLGGSQVMVSSKVAKVLQENGNILAVLDALIMSAGASRPVGQFCGEKTI